VPRNVDFLLVCSSGTYLAMASLSCLRFLSSLTVLKLFKPACGTVMHTIPGWARFKAGGRAQHSHDSVLPTSYCCRLQHSQPSAFTVFTAIFCMHEA
jgi:hypothetical protein